MLCSKDTSQLMCTLHSLVSLFRVQLYASLVAGILCLGQFRIYLLYMTIALIFWTSSVYLFGTVLYLNLNLLSCISSQFCILSIAHINPAISLLPQK